MSTERDTKFNSFSALLLHDIKLLMRVWEEARQNGDFAHARVIEGQIQDVFARRGYDLVFRHALVYLREGVDIPDMTEWPVGRDE